MDKIVYLYVHQIKYTIKSFKHAYVDKGLENEMEYVNPALRLPKPIIIHVSATLVYLGI
jgi:hypothetical protein